MRRMQLCSLLLLILSGCLPTYYVEDLAIVTIIGTDVVDDGHELDVTFVYFDFEDKKAVPKLVQGRNLTISGAAVDARSKVKYQLIPDKIQMTLFGIDTAKQGIRPVIDILSRDPRFTDNIAVALSEVTAREILQAQNHPVIQGDIGQHLQEIILKNSQHNEFPHIPFNELLIDIDDGGKDPILPMFSLDDQNIPILTSIALLQGDRYVGRLSFNEVILFNLLSPKSVRDKRFHLELPIKPFEKYLERKDDNLDHIGVAFELIKGKNKIQLKDEQSISFQTNVSIKMSIIEIVGLLPMDDIQVVRLLEKEMEKLLTSRFEALIDTLKSFNVDPIGYGDIYRIATKQRELDRSKWQELIPDIEVTFDVHVKILNFGEHR